MSLKQILIAAGLVTAGTLAASDAEAQEKPRPVVSSEEERKPENSSIFRMKVKRPVKVIEKEGEVRTRYLAEKRKDYGVTVTGQNDDGYGDVSVENETADVYTDTIYTVRGHPDETITDAETDCSGLKSGDDKRSSALVLRDEEGTCEYDFVFTRKGRRGKNIDRKRHLTLNFTDNPDAAKDETPEETTIRDPYDDYGLQIKRTAPGEGSVNLRNPSNTPNKRVKIADVENNSGYEITPTHDDEKIILIPGGCADSRLVSRTTSTPEDIDFETGNEKDSCEKSCVFRATLEREDGEKRLRAMALNFPDCPEKVEPEVPVEPTTKDKKLVSVSGEVGMGYSNVRHGGDSMTQEFQAYAPSALVGLYFNTKSGNLTVGSVWGYQLKHFVDGNEHSRDLGTAMEHDWIGQLGFRFGQADGNHGRINLGGFGRHLKQEGKDITLGRRNLGGFFDAQIDLPELLSKERFGMGGELDYQLQIMAMEASVDGNTTDLGLQQNHRLKGLVPFRFGAQGNAWKVAPGFQWDRVYDPTRKTGGGTKGEYDSFALALELGKEFSNGELELVGLIPLGKNYQAGGAARWTNADGNMAFGVEYLRGMTGTTTDHTLLGTFAIGSKDADIYMPVSDVLRDSTPQ